MARGTAPPSCTAAGSIRAEMVVPILSETLNPPARRAGPRPVPGPRAQCLVPGPRPSPGRPPGRPAGPSRQAHGPARTRCGRRRAMRRRPSVVPRPAPPPDPASAADPCRRDGRRSRARPVPGPVPSRRVRPSQRAAAARRCRGLARGLARGTAAGCASADRPRSGHRRPRRTTVPCARRQPAARPRSRRRRVDRPPTWTVRSRFGADH